MTEREAFALVGFILVGYPRERPWSDQTIQLWAEELAEVGPAEGQTAVRQMFRSADFPSLRAFNVALASVRERHHAEQAAANFDLPALPAVPTPPESVARARREVADYCQRWRAKSTRALAVDQSRRVPLRVDQTYDWRRGWSEPEPQPPPEGGFT